MRLLLACAVLLIGCGSNDHHDAVDAGADASKPISCGGTTCGAKQYCDYLQNTCGSNGEVGMCVDRPQECPALVGTPTCGCDGKVYASACDAASSGSTDLNVNGTCPVDSTHFACGFDQCNLATQYCKHNPAASATIPDTTYTCVALPGTCTGNASCGCVANETCGSSCTGDATHGVIVTCS
jgi:hypothetical protein